MKLAVLVCVYKNDRLDFFKCAIESIWKQINIDPNSINIYLHIDGTLPEDLYNYIISQSFYKVVESKENVGLAKGLNKLLLSLNDEDFIFRMDSDDIASEDRFYKQITHMLKNDSDLSGGSITEFINSESNIINKRTYPLEHSNICNSMSKASPLGHVTICFRGSSLSKIGLYPTQYLLNEDIALWYQALRNGCLFSNISDVLVNVRMDGAYARRTYRKAVNEFKVYSKISFYQKKLPFYAILRLFFRLLPSSAVEIIYNSKLRKIITSS